MATPPRHQIAERRAGESTRTAFDIIRWIELERSGIRDGDGCWHADVIAGETDDLMKACQRVRTAYGLDLPPRPLTPDEVLSIFGPETNKGD
jgi:hypothetical protein